MSIHTTHTTHTTHTIDAIPLARYAKCTVNIRSAATGAMTKLSSILINAPVIALVIAALLINQTTYATNTSPVSHVNDIHNNPAVTNQSKISDDLNTLKNQIKQMNRSLKNKHHQANSITQALDSSKQAIEQSNQLLNDLQHRRTIDIAELNNIKHLMQQVTQNVELSKKQITLSLKAVYKEIIKLNNNSSRSIFNNNQALTDKRNAFYLTKILQARQQQLLELNNQLNTLVKQNNNIEDEINALNLRLSSTNSHLRLLQQEAITKQEQSKTLTIAIHADAKKLHQLQEEEGKLDSLLKQIILANNASRAHDDSNRLSANNRNRNATNVASNNNSSNNNNNSSTDNATSSGVHRTLSNNTVANNNTSDDMRENLAYEDNSDFIRRQLVRPMSSSVSIVEANNANNANNATNTISNSTMRNGILFQAQEGDLVYAIGKGKVVYCGNLPGFGQVVIIDHGNNYMSIYSGVIAQVKRYATVNTKDVIATIGKANTMPKGGMYFEIRHLGIAVNAAFITHL